MTQPIDPDGTPVDRLRQLREEVEQLQQRNDQVARQLAAQGVAIDQASLIGVRVVKLIEAVLGDMDDPRRLQYELDLAQTYAAQMSNAAHEMARARLLQGVQLGGNGHRP